MGNFSFGQMKFVYEDAVVFPVERTIVFCGIGGIAEKRIENPLVIEPNDYTLIRRMVCNLVEQHQPSSPSIIGTSPDLSHNE
jgi:hypothetical protein